MTTLGPGRGFDEAHPKLGFDAEKDITGWRRKGYLDIYNTTVTNGITNGTMKLYYSNSEKLTGFVNKGFVFVIVNGNYVSVTPEKKQ